jgi:hypothetical protein
MQRNLDADDLTPVSDDLAVWQTIPKIERVTSVAFLQFRATGDSQRLVAMRICHVDSSLVANAGGFARFPGFTPRIPVNRWRYLFRRRLSLASFGGRSSFGDDD